ncbi:hypothetical protein [Micromonospora chersina]|uniref:hypothetical protein n=1 Tax=Micromonospora chersina TaxID=47854 RepID=UPI0033BBB602
MGLVIALAALTPAVWSGIGDVLKDLGRWGGGDSDQLKYQATIEGNRQALFRGSLYALTDQEVVVDDWFPVVVYLCGPNALPLDCENPAELPHPGATPTASRTPQARDVLLGGRVAVRLHSGDPDLRIRKMHESPVKPLTSRIDVGTWIWSVSARSVGIYLVTAEVSVLAGDSDRLLLPPENVVIKVTAVPPTAKHAPPAQNPVQPTRTAVPTSQAPTTAEAKGIANSDTGWSIEKVAVPFIVALIGGLCAIVAARITTKRQVTSPEVKRETERSEAVVTGEPTASSTAQPPPQPGPDERDG